MRFMNRWELLAVDLISSPPSFNSILVNMH